MSITERLIRARAAAASNSLELDSENPESREDCVRKDLTRRLKNICQNLSSGDFEALVMKMTREQMRGEGVTNRRASPVLTLAATREVPRDGVLSLPITH